MAWRCECSTVTVPALLGLPRPALGAVLLVGWSGALLVSLYRYDRGRISRSQLYLSIGGALLTIGFSLTLISEAFAGAASIAVDVLFLVASIAGVALVVLWWLTRELSETDEPGAL